MANLSEKPTNEPKIEELDSDDSDGEGVNNTSSSGKTLNRAEKKTRKAISKLGLKPYNGASDNNPSAPKPGDSQGKVIRVTVKKQKNILFVISSPDVWRSGDGQTWCCFGEARIEDLSSQQAALRGMAGKGGMGGGMGGMGGQMANLANAMASLKGGDPAALEALAGAAKGGDTTAALEALAAAQGKVGEGGSADGENSGKKPASDSSSDVAVEEKDIELVVTQVGCTREKAIDALKNNKNDIVEAIMSFNM